MTSQDPPTAGAVTVSNRHVPTVSDGGPPVSLTPQERRAAIAERAEAFGDWRAGLKRFVLEHLREGEYEPSGYLQIGKQHDYYRVAPGGAFALSKSGAEKVSQFLAWVRGGVETTRVHEAKDFVSITKRAHLVDVLTGQVRGSAEASATSSEKGFQKGLAKKYGGDFRAALHDIASRAEKRAYVQAVTLSSGMTEVFAEIEADRAADAARREKLKAVDAQGLPVYMPGGEHEGMPIDRVPTRYLAEFLERLREEEKAPRLMDKIEQVLLSREQA
jgi:hypothetical protein